MILFLKNLAFTVFVPGVVAVAVPLLIAGRRAFEARWTVVPALLLLALGGAMYLWCLWDFATFGRGTPAPIDAPKRLVVRGLYRYSRNPMYVAVLAVVLGWVLFFAEPKLLFYWMGVAMCFHLFVVFYEEPRLHRSFGSEYESYRSSVGRWIF